MSQRFLLLVFLSNFIFSLFFPSITDAELPTSITILSYNIRHGEGIDGKIALKRIAKVINSVNPDIVALQEVDRNTLRSGNVDQPAELARLTGMNVVFERNIEYEGGDYGNAILSRFPIIRHKNHPLPSFYNGEQRGALEVELKLDMNNTILFFATHLDYRENDQERIASAKFIENIIQQKPDIPTILAGDLNDTPTSSTLNLFRQIWINTSNGHNTPTFPSTNPERQLDYILFRPENHWTIIKVQVINEAIASDHRPLLAILKLQFPD